MRARALADRPPRADLRAEPRLPADTRLWAALQDAAAALGRLRVRRRRDPRGARGGQESALGR